MGENNSLLFLTKVFPIIYKVESFSFSFLLASAVTALQQCPPAVPGEPNPHKSCCAAPSTETGTPGQRAHGSTWERPDVWPAVSFQQQRALFRDPFVPSVLTRWGDRIWEISSREGVCSCSKTIFVKCPEQMRKAVLAFQWQSLSEAAVKWCGKKEAATLGKWQFKTHGYLADESCHVQGSLWLWMLQDVLLNGVCFKDRQVSAPSETALCLGYVLNVITSVIYSFFSFNVCER